MAMAFRVLLCFCVFLQLVNCQFGFFSDVVETTKNVLEAVIGNRQPQSHQPVNINEYTPYDQDDSYSAYEPLNNDASCTAVDHSEGTCVNPLSCKAYEELARKPRYDFEAQSKLRRARCGVDDGHTPKVCCPLRLVTQNTVVTTTTTTTERAELTNNDYKLLESIGQTCTTVYNTTGRCTTLNDCKPFLALAVGARTNPAIKSLLKQAKCSSTESHKVCCPLPSQSDPSPDQSTSLPDQSTPAQALTSCAFLPSVDSRNVGAGLANKLPALLEPPFCGWSDIQLDRVVGGVPAKLGALPWMALLGHKDPTVSSDVMWKCGGVLISNRHVLTAAHCIQSYENTLSIVRLGELDLAREDEGATPIDIPIKAMIKHEKYSSNQQVYYDIAILELQREVNFTNLIRPICLFPSNKCFNETFEDYNPILAGWGNTNWKGKVKTTHLQVAQIPVINTADCHDLYKTYTTKKEQFLEQALCAGHPTGEVDSCKGDSGGPLMQPLTFKDKKSYMYAIGVVSAGAECALSGSPGVYSRVTYYMPWIEEKLLG